MVFLQLFFIVRGMNRHPNYYPEEPYHLPETEPLPLAEARFMDRLEPQYEELWGELLDSVEAQGKPVNSLLVPVWASPEFPQSFRDRAMLYVVGSGPLIQAMRPNAKRLFTGSILVGGIDINYLSQTSAFTPAAFAAWLRQAVDYQTASGEALFGDGAILGWAKDLYEAEAIDAPELERYITNVDITKASPCQDDDGYDLERNRFPILADVLNWRLTKSTTQPRVQQWALGRLEDWLALQRGAEREVPDWVRSATAEQGHQLYKDIAAACSYDRLPWRAAWPGIEHYGWELVTTDQRLAVELAQKMDDPELRTSLITHLLIKNTAARQVDTGKPYLFQAKQLSFMRQALGAAEPQLAEYLDVEENMRSEYDAAYELRRLADQQQWQEEFQNRPEEVAKRAAATRFEGLLRVIGEIQK
ncbi:MAG: hypothetical protein JWN38_817 [Candidatus Saccharibacteria bacterium]|nr:hypothetical protein [Candidatus Saccharibacteria bacterium]